MLLPGKILLASQNVKHKCQYKAIALAVRQIKKKRCPHKIYKSMLIVALPILIKT